MYLSIYSDSHITSKKQSYLPSTCLAPYRLEQGFSPSVDKTHLNEGFKYLDGVETSTPFFFDFCFSLYIRFPYPGSACSPLSAPATGEQLPGTPKNHLSQSASFLFKFFIPVMANVKRREKFAPLFGVLVCTTKTSKHD